jgi:KaiC/GvpD/RAD55 family RecA-like ATPase
MGYTVFPGVDELIPEKVPEGYFIILTGPPAIGKGVFAAQFAFHGLSIGEKVVYIAVDSPPSEMRKIQRRYGWDPEKYEREGSLRFIDCYSWRFGGSFEEKYYITDPANLTEVSLKLEEARTGLEPPLRVVVDSFSSLTLRTRAQTAVSFLEALEGKVAKYGCLALCVVEEGVHSRRTMSILRSIADGIFEMKVVEEGGRLRRYFRVFTIRGLEPATDWMRFEISKSGIKFKSA